MSLREGPGSCFTISGLLSVKLCKSKQNCAVSLGREGPGSCLTISGLLSVKLCVNNLKKLNKTVPSVWVEKGRGFVLPYSVCSVLLSNTYGYALAETPWCSGAVTGRKLLCIRKISAHTLLNRVSIKGRDGTTGFSCLAGWIQA